MGYCIVISFLRCASADLTIHPSGRLRRRLTQALARNATNLLLLVFSLLALAIMSPALLVVSAGLCFVGRLHLLGRQMLIFGIAAALLFCLFYAMLIAIFVSVPNDLLQSLLVVAGSGFSIGSMGRVAVVVVAGMRSNYSSDRTRYPLTLNSGVRYPT